MNKCMLTLISLISLPLTAMEWQYIKYELWHGETKTFERPSSAGCAWHLENNYGKLVDHYDSRPDLYMKILPIINIRHATKDERDPEAMGGSITNVWSIEGNCPGSAHLCLTLKRGEQVLELISLDVLVKPRP